MTSEQFKAFMKVSTFQPFAVHLGDGRSVNVVHPDSATVSTSGRTASILNADGVIEVVDLLLVTSLRPLPEREREPDQSANT